jgi:hypothetical protein
MGRSSLIAGRLLIALALLAFVGCSSGGDETAQKPADDQMAMTDENTDTGVEEPLESPEVKEAEEPTPEPEPKPEPKPKPKAEAKPKPKPKPEPKEEEPPPAPKPVMVTIPSGTALAATLDTKVRTDSNAVGDPIVATLGADLMAEGKTAIPSGSKLHGQVTDIDEPHRSEGKAHMTLSFDKVVTPDGRSYALVTAPLAFEAKGDKISDEAKVGIGGAIGGVVGALTSKNKTKGAVVGAAAGAVAGGAIAVATKGKQLELAPGQALTVEVTQAAEVELPQ